MLIKFGCGFKAPYYPRYEEFIDLKERFGITDDEWINMPVDEKLELVEEWAEDHLQAYYVETRNIQ